MAIERRHECVQAHDVNVYDKMKWSAYNSVCSKVRLYAYTRINE